MITLIQLHLQQGNFQYIIPELLQKTPLPQKRTALISPVADRPALPAVFIPIDRSAVWLIRTALQSAVFIPVGGAVSVSTGSSLKLTVIIPVGGAVPAGAGSTDQHPVMVAVSDMITVNGRRPQQFAVVIPVNDPVAGAVSSADQHTPVVMHWNILIDLIGRGAEVGYIKSAKECSCQQKKHRNQFFHHFILQYAPGVAS